MVKNAIVGDCELGNARVLVLSRREENGSEGYCCNKPGAQSSLTLGEIMKKNARDKLIDYLEKTYGKFKHMGRSYGKKETIKKVN